MKLFPNIAFPWIVNSRDRYQRKGNQSHTETSEMLETCLVLLVGPTKYCAPFISGEISKISELFITIDTV